MISVAKLSSRKVEPSTHLWTIYESTAAWKRNPFSWFPRPLLCQAAGVVLESYNQPVTQQPTDTQHDTHLFARPFGMRCMWSLAHRTLLQDGEPVQASLVPSCRFGEDFWLPHHHVDFMIGPVSVHFDKRLLHRIVKSRMSDLIFLKEIVMIFIISSL